MSAIQQLRDLSKVQIGVGVLIAAFSAVGGAALGAKLAVDRLGEQLRLEADEALQKEIADAKTFYAARNKTEEFETPEKALEKLHPEAAAAAASALLAYEGKAAPVVEPQKVINYSGITPNKPELKEVAQNVFTDSAYIPEEFDYEKELLNRDPEKPYLITYEEHEEAGPEYDQVDFTYYAGDGVLCNASDETVDGNWDLIVGNDNLTRFGHGSKDENVVYIRNVALEMDIEITRSPGKYSEEVLGFDADDDIPETELRHSADRRPRKFRHED